MKPILLLLCLFTVIVGCGRKYEYTPTPHGAENYHGDHGQYPTGTKRVVAEKEWYDEDTVYRVQELRCFSTAGDSWSPDWSAPRFKSEKTAIAWVKNDGAIRVCYQQEAKK